MYGYVLTYSIQTGEGAISSDDGNRYSFTNRDWMGEEAPERGARVEFATTGSQATNIHPVVVQVDDRPLLPAVAAGCGAGCAVYIVAGLVLTMVTGIGFGRFWRDGGTSGGSGTVWLLFIALGLAFVIGYLVYRAVRNRPR